MTQWCFEIRKLSERAGAERFALTLASDRVLPGGHKDLSIEAPLSIQQMHARLTEIGIPLESIANQVLHARARYEALSLQEPAPERPDAGKADRDVGT
jgi:hypothetical protein